MTNEEKDAQRKVRDQAICDEYMSGATLRDCGRLFRLNPTRIKQIVTAAGLWRERPRNARSSFIGVEVSPETKEAVKKKAEETGVSVSKFASDRLEEAVK